jgi:hypothetical protein
VIPGAWIVAGALIVAVMGTAADLLIGRFRLTASERVRAAARMLVLGLAAAMAASLLLSVFLQFPHLQRREAWTPASPGEYVGAALGAALTPFRLRDPDFLTWTSLWGAFGWVDRMLAAPVVVALAAATALAGIVTLMRAARGAQAPWILLFIVSCAASVAVYGLVSYGLARNLHGRYLLAMFVVLQAVLWSGVARVPRGATWALILCGALALHAYALRFLLLSYFD